MDKDEMGIYKVNKKVLETFYEELIRLEDWVPFMFKQIR